MQPVSYSIKEAARSIGIGRTKLYELIHKGELVAIKIGRRTLVTTASIEALVNSTEGAQL
jgi:excisionase family DNA binding protein